ncbi:MAG: hypothetical protein Sw1PiTSA_13490 [Shewanella algae]|nr:hypothetical protein TUM3811_14980 [Shewanella algae]GHB04211.1 hypothetical protein GCM10007107_16310 [Shewanella indica]BCV33132.1 hypothetical protein TUM4442_26590 [Shewanella algae]BCV41470.1 hypothetical protein TUM17378_27320 [Shewanella algae]BCV50123.1 hypothetical protein TUM17382_28160 [Shewanella algae]
MVLMLCLIRLKLSEFIAIVSILHFQTLGPALYNKKVHTEVDCISKIRLKLKPL